MENFIKLMLAFGIGLLLVLLAMPKVIPFLHKMKFGQVEREEGLESHKKKGGTARKTRTWTNWTMSIWYSPVMPFGVSSMIRFATV